MATLKNVKATADRFGFKMIRDMEWEEVEIWHKSQSREASASFTLRDHAGAIEYMVLEAGLIKCREVLGLAKRGLNA